MFTCGNHFILLLSFEQQIRFNSSCSFVFRALKLSLFIDLFAGHSDRL